MLRRRLDDLHAGNVLLDSYQWPPAITLKHSTIAHSLGYGIWLDCAALLEAADNEFLDDNWDDQASENCD